MLLYKLNEDIEKGSGITIEPGTVLYHGTVESFDTRQLRGGGYDNIVWTAKSKNVALSYIPTSGITTYASIDIIARDLSNYDSKDAKEWMDMLGISKELIYSLLDKGYEIQKKSMELYREYKDLEKKVSDGDYRYLSHEEMKDILRREDELSKKLAKFNGIGPMHYIKLFIKKKIEQQFGYSQTDYGSYKLKTSIKNGKSVLHHADYKIKGRLIELTAKESVTFADLRHGDEGDLMDLEYHNHGGFEKAKEQGYQGVYINDFAQHEKYGNVGHRSFGIFPESIKLFEIRAVRDQTHPDDIYNS